VPQLITEYKNQHSVITDTYDCDLLVLNENRYVTYCILRSGNQFELLREYKQTEDEQFTDFHEGVLSIDENLNRPYRNVRIGISNKRLVLVPGAVFRREQSVHYLENSAPIWSTDEVRVDTLEKQGIKLVYAFRSSIYQAYHDHFANMAVENALSRYVGTLDAIVARQGAGHRVFINALYDTMYIVLYRNEQLTYANVYEFTTAEDFLYYVMLIYKEFQLDQDVTPSYISGKLDKDSVLHDLLMRYIRNLYFIHELDQPSLVINGIPPQLYFDLFALHS